MKKYVVRPSNVVTLIFFLLGVFFLSIIPIGIISAIVAQKSVAFVLLYALFSSIIGGWISSMLLSVVFRPKIVLYDDHLEAFHWEKGIPYDSNHPFRLSKIEKSVIQYADLTLYGAFFAKDIVNYLEKGSGLLAKKWFVATSSPIPIPIQLPAITTRMRDVMMFVSSDGNSLVLDGGPYGYRQVQNMLYEIELRSGTKSEGRVTPRKSIDNFVLNLLCSLVKLSFFTVFPLVPLMLESLFNPLHTFGYDSPWRILYFCSLFIGNLCLGIFMVSKKQNADPEIKHIQNISKKVFIILYLIFIVSFIISIFN